MTSREFEHEMLKAKTFAETGSSYNYWRGYQRGLRRRFHGENFGEPGEHEKWLSLIHDETRRELGRGYRDGYFGPAQ